MHSESKLKFWTNLSWLKPLFSLPSISSIPAVSPSWTLSSGIRHQLPDHQLPHWRDVETQTSGLRHPLHGGEDWFLGRFCIFLLQEIDKEISEMKLSVNSRARICAEEFLKRVSSYSFYYYSYFSWSSCFCSPGSSMSLSSSSSSERPVILVIFYCPVPDFVPAKLHLFSIYCHLYED